MKTLRQIYESLRFAAKALKSNVLRRRLSLLGVTVGIFAIISVLTVVDSLERSIKDSLNFLGTGVIMLVSGLIQLITMRSIGVGFQAMPQCIRRWRHVLIRLLPDARYNLE
jgi:hypothetical protein